jgi:energy-coupling factor transporter ATP-binding protein EcfA2
MQLIWYLPSLIIGLTAGISSGYWQLALISTLMVSLMLGVSLYKNRYPVFDPDSKIDVSAGQVAIANRVLPRIELFWKKQWHELLLANHARQIAPDFLASTKDQIFENGFDLDKTQSLQLWIGANNSSQKVLSLATAGPHLIIVGPTGSGKSELIKLVMHSLIQESACDLVLFDFKGGATLEQFEPQAVGLATDLDPSKQKQLWDFVSGELEKREQIFASRQVSGIEQFQQLGERMSEIVVVVDEFAAALATGAKALSCLEDVCARGRSLGVHLIAATQSLTGIPRSMLTNLRARIAMASSDPIDLVQLGMNPSKLSLASVAGWGSGYLATANTSAEGFYFPLGFTPKLKLEVLIPSGEQPPPARSQLLRQMYSSPEPKQDQPAAPASIPESQLLSRMEGLRWSAHK